MSCVRSFDQVSSPLVQAMIFLNYTFPSYPERALVHNKSKAAVCRGSAVNPKLTLCLYFRGGGSTTTARYALPLSRFNLGLPHV